MKPVDWGHYSAQKRWKWAVLESKMMRISEDSIVPLFILLKTRV